MHARLQGGHVQAAAKVIARLTSKQPPLPTLLLAGDERPDIMPGWLSHAGKGVW